MIFRGRVIHNCVLLNVLCSFNTKDNSLLPILEVFIMKSHKEPLKNVLFANTELIKIILCAHLTGIFTVC